MNAWIDCLDEFTTELTLTDLGDCRILKETQAEIIEANEASVVLISMFA